jgi:sarcosine oxidase/L-pipecolate oxidase
MASVDYQIIGCGIFGLTLALELKRRQPDVRIRLFDRFEPPVPDGASVDQSRIVRADYADPVYAQLGLEARKAWLADTELCTCYHETGFILTVQGEDDRGYLESCLANVREHGIDAAELSHEQIFDRLKQPVSSTHTLRGYSNPKSGWADAEATIRILYKRLRGQPGVSFVFEAVKRLVYDQETVMGLETESHARFDAGQTVLATGAWQLADVPVPTLATGQVIAWITSSAEDERQLSPNMPVLINFSSGWFALPPYKGEIKIARHALGYTNMQLLNDSGSSRMVSVPRTSISHPGQTIPDEGEKALREGLRLFLPHLADEPFVRTRVCWYSDTPTGDFLIDWHPTKRNLFVATGGSGHAFKFAPILGTQICNVLLGTNSDSLIMQERRRRWSFERALKAQSDGRGDGSRGLGEHLEWIDFAQQEEQA